MTPAKPSQTSFERIPTGIQGMDTLLKGGLLRGGVYLVMGQPGCGKTIVGNQMCFHHVANGGRALYVTLLAESHSRMFGNLRPLSFFKEDEISESINYIGGYSVLERDGLNGLIKMLGEAIRKFKSTLLVIDGIASVEDVAETRLSFKKFVHQLNSVLSTSGCTTLLLSSMDTGPSQPEHTMVDGIISLSIVSDAHRDFHQIEIRKFRGSDHLKGRHFYRITDDGIKICPRIESYLGSSVHDVLKPSERCLFDIKKLDQMLGGGLMVGSTTSLLGPAGSGKSSIGTQFLVAGAKKGDRGLYYGFYEAPARWAPKMDAIGIPASQFVKKGLVQAVWRPEAEINVDEVFEEILGLVKQHGLKRVFFDGVGGLRETMFAPSRLNRAISAFSHELRSMGVTTLFTEETEIFAEAVSAPISDLSAATDNVFFMRQVEVDSELRRLLTIFKQRESNSDRKIHEFEITPKGIEINGPFRQVEALIRGVTHRPSRGPVRKKGRSRK